MVVRPLRHRPPEQHHPDAAEHHTEQAHPGEHHPRNRREREGDDELGRGDYPVMVVSSTNTGTVSVSLRPESRTVASTFRGAAPKSVSSET